MNRDGLSELFTSCLNAEYVNVGDGGSFSIEVRGDALYIFFEKSKGIVDWHSNLDFGAVLHSELGREARAVTPYKRMDEKWYCHGGFLRVWRSVLPYLEWALLDLRFGEIVTVGYSHGAALALLCHEYLWFNRRDLRGKITGYGFGCPRVIYGRVPKEKERWKDFYVIRNYDDIVTHLPPRSFGFRHVGRMITVGGIGRYSRIDAHRKESYMSSLEEIKKNRDGMP